MKNKIFALVTGILGIAPSSVYARQSPNIILIMADDLGWGDVGFKEKGYITGHFGKWHLGTLTYNEKDANRGGSLIPAFQHNKARVKPMIFCYQKQGAVIEQKFKLYYSKRMPYKVGSEHIPVNHTKLFRRIITVLFEQTGKIIRIVIA